MPGGRRAVQAYFHDVWMPAEIKKRHPELSGDALTREVERYWAAPSESDARPAPHATGAAMRSYDPLEGRRAFVDGLDLRRCRPILPIATVSKSASGEMRFSDEEARANRRLLHWVMSEEGFEGHPDEWWHFSYGDQLWAALSGAPAAHYGLAKEEE